MGRYMKGCCIICNCKQDDKNTFWRQEFCDKCVKKYNLKNKLEQYFNGHRIK